MLALFAVSVAFLACERVVAPSGYVTSVVLRLPHDSLFLGKSVQAVAVATGDSAVVAAPEFTWTSSDTNVAVVDENGVILAVGLGTATITAELRGQLDVFTIRTSLPRSDGGVEFDIGSPSQSFGDSCAVSTAGRVYCSPARSDDSLRTYAPMPRSEGVVLSSVYAGFENVCGLDATGAMYCWGSNGDYILASRLPIRTDTAPLPVNTALRFSTMSAGDHTTACAAEMQTSVVHCWGHNHFGALGRATTATGGSASDSVVAPVTDSLRAKQVATTVSGACALDLDGKVFCWGSRAQVFGVPVPVPLNPPAPRPVPGDMSFASLALVTTHACALTSDGEAYCFGQNAQGQLGLGHADVVAAGPHRVATDVRFTSIYALATEGSCAISVDGDLWCWGRVAPASVAARMGARAYSPFRVAAGVKFRALTMGDGYICGITLARQLVCW